jgi:hypothetical protein
MVKNILGNGIDIPLLGLREASREVEGELHELFTDECYKIANCFLLSTSQVMKFKYVEFMLCEKNAQNKIFMHFKIFNAHFFNSHTITRIAQIRI